MAKKSAQPLAEEDRQVGDSFWDQWSTTSLADVSRDTYGPEKRSNMERELRTDAE
jgi:hypothetical protein